MKYFKHQIYYLLVGLSYWSFRAFQVVTSPFLTIRIDTVFAQRIGHLVSECEQVLVDATDSHSTRRQIDLVIFPPGNTYLVNYYATRFRERPNTRVIIPRDVRFSPLAYAGAEMRRRYFAGERSRSSYCGPLTNGGQFLLRQSLPERSILSIPVAEVSAARRVLERIGLLTDRPIICLHIRDSAYLDSRHHDYRDPPLDAYVLLVEHLISVGYAVVRTGSVARTQLPLSNPAFLDYAFSDVRSDTMDVMLYAACELAIAGSLSGPSALAVAMRKPLVICDLRPVFQLTYSPDKCRFIFSTMRWKHDGTQLTLKEMLHLNTFDTAGFEAAGAEFIPNTANELIAVTSELLTASTVETCPSAHHAPFWRFIRENSLHPDEARIRPEFMPQIGAEFLQEHTRALGL